MATSIKTRILLPRGTVNSLSARTFTVGELVLINTGSKFKPVEITLSGTGLTGNGAATYAELELSALQIKLSTDVTLQSAYDSIASTVNGLSTYALIAAQLSNDGYALTTSVVGTASDLSSADTINGAKKYAKQYTDLEAANVVGTSTDLSSASTIYGAKKYAKQYTDQEAANIIGTASDLSSASTIYGAKKYAQQYTDQEAAKKSNVKVAQTYSSTPVQADISVIKVTDAELTAYAEALLNDSLNPNALYVLNLSATNALGQKIENMAAGTIETDGATYGQLSAALATINTKFNDYALTANVYTKSELTGSSGILTAYALSNDVYGKQDVYTKSELTSNSGILTAYALSNDVYGKQDVYTKSELTGNSGVLTSYAKTADIGISYDSVNKKIYLAGGNSTSAEINASDFIKDGMLSDAFYDTDTKKLVLVFNTDAGASDISVDIGDLVDTYTADDTSTIDMSVSNNTFSASIINGSITPTLLSANAEWVFDCNL